MNETSLDNAQVLSSCRNTLCVISISIIEYIFLKSPGTQKKKHLSAKNFQHIRTFIND